MKSWGLLIEVSHDLDYLVSMLDWDANVNPEFAKSNELGLDRVKALEERESEGHFGTADPDAQSPLRS